MKYYLALSSLIFISTLQIIVLAVDIPDNIFLTNLIDVKHDEANSTLSNLNV